MQFHIHITQWHCSKGEQQMGIVLPNFSVTVTGAQLYLVSVRDLNSSSKTH